MVWSQLISDNHMGTSKTGPSEFSVLEQESRALYPLINQHHWMLTNHKKGLRCGVGCLSPGKDNFQWGLTDEGHLLSRVSAVGKSKTAVVRGVYCAVTAQYPPQMSMAQTPFSFLFCHSKYVVFMFMIGSWSQDGYFTPSLFSVLWVGARRKPKGGKGSTYIRKAIISWKYSTIFYYVSLETVVIWLF